MSKANAKTPHGIPEPCPVPWLYSIRLLPLNDVEREWVEEARDWAVEMLRRDDAMKESK